MYNVQEFDEQKTKVMKYIVFKKRTEQEIRNKFANSINPEMLDDIIEYLKEAEYINDKDYIERAINNYMLLKNLSIKELKYKLMQKGLNTNEIEDYIYEHREELQKYEIKSAQNIFNKKNKDMQAEEIKQYLLKKGYKLDTVNMAINYEI